MSARRVNFGTCSIDGCERVAKCRGWCATHYGRWWVHGDPMAVKLPESRPVLDRFWEKVDRRGDDECWNWTAGRNRWGYGKFSPRTPGHMGAHRFSAMLHFGMFDLRLLVLHHCDNPACVNPAHLYLGTDADNARDKRVRGRSRNQWTGKLVPACSEES